jgi:hypothetical protein
MNNIDIEKCDTVFDDITEWAKYDINGTRYYRRSAREVEARLFLDYQCKDEITTAEHCYILGRIYADALAVGGEDFFRV